MSGTLRLRGATSGYSELQAPAVAADQTFILPTAGGTLLTTDSPVPKLTLELGSASQPSLTFEGDTDTGLYSSGTNTLNLVTGGNNRLTIDSSGNVGIGTTSPSQPLTVGGVARFENFIEFAGSISTPGTAAAIYRPADNNLAFSTASTERIRIDSLGNVGVGTSSPGGYKLHVAGNVLIGQANSLLFGSSSGPAPKITNSGQQNSLSFFTNGSESARIDSSGNVKFEYTDSSTSTATQTPPGLRIYNKDNTLGRLAGIHFSHGGAGTANAGIFHVTTSTATGSTTCLGDLAFYMKASGSSTMVERMRIDSSGNVGIGTTSPVSSLTVVANSGAGGLDINGRSSDGIGQLNFLANNGTTLHSRIQTSSSSTFIGSISTLEFATGGSFSERMRIDSSGNVIVGGTSTSSTNAAYISQNGTYVSNRTAGTNDLWNGMLNGTVTSTINADGSATFVGSIIHGSLAPGGGGGNYFAVGEVAAYSPAAGNHVWRGWNASSSPNVNTSQIYANGNAVFAGTVTASNVSDIRFKENITDANPQLADAVALGLQLKNFDWNDDAPLNDELRAKRFLGLVAQEAEKVCPSLTYTVPRTKQGKELTPAVLDEDGNETKAATYEELDDSYKAINHDILVMKLLGAVAELSAKVAVLENA